MTADWTNANANVSVNTPKDANAAAGKKADVAPPPAAATRRVALIVAAAFFMMLLDGAILNTSLPLMAQSLGVTPLALTAGVTVYLLAAAANIPASGWLADRWEARRVFSIAIAVFTLASLGCGLSQNLGQLVAARGVDRCTGRRCRGQRAQNAIRSLNWHFAHVLIQ